MMKSDVLVVLCAAQAQVSCYHTNQNFTKKLFEQRELRKLFQSLPRHRHRNFFQQLNFLKSTLTQSLFLLRLHWLSK